MDNQQIHELCPLAYENAYRLPFGYICYLKYYLNIISVIPYIWKVY